jgi:hypothetical protein
MLTRGLLTLTLLRSVSVNLAELRRAPAAGGGAAVILDVKFLIFSKGREEDKEGVILDIFPRLLPIRRPRLWSGQVGLETRDARMWG